MKKLITHMYNKPLNIKAWVIGFVRREEVTLAIVLCNEGTITNHDISSIKLKVNK